MARPPKPTEQKREQGTLRGHRERGKAPEPPPLKVAPTPPAGLSDRAVATWKAYAEVLVTRRFLAEGDLLALEMLCREWARYLDLFELVQEEGASVVTEAGPKRNPNAIEMNAALKNATVCLREFGLTPSARIRVRGVGGAPEDENPFDRFRLLPGGKVPGGKATG